MWNNQNIICPKRSLYVAPPPATWSANNETLSAQDDYLVAYWKGDGTTDLKGSNTLSAEPSGGTPPTYTNDEFNLVRANDNYMSASDSADFYFNMNNFTFAMVVEFDTIPSSAAVYGLYSQKTDNNNLMGWRVRESSGSVYMNLIQRNASTFDINTNSDALTLSTSTKYLLVLSRVGTTFTFYQNSTGVGSFVDADDLINLSGGFLIGNYDDTAVNGFNGKIKLCGVWNGYGADSSFVTALYNSGTFAEYTG
jgi:hypothetical protein